jgi:hypothetical protein
LIGLSTAAVVCVVAAAAALATGGPETNAVGLDARALPALAAELGEVGTVELKRQDLDVTFRRKGEDWLVEQKGGYPADAGKVRQVVLALADMTLVEPKTREPKLYPRLEVEDPGKGKSALVSLSGQKGEKIGALIIGKRSYDRLGAGNDGVYVREPGKAQSWLARGGLDLSGDLVGWLDRQVIDIKQGRIAKVTLTQTNGTSLVLSRKTADGKFAVEGAAADTKYKNDTATGEPAQALETLDLTDVVPAAKMPLPKKGVATASYTTFDGLTVELKLFEDNKKDWVAVAATGTGKAAAEAKKIEARVSPWRYQIPQFKAQMLQTKLADLLAPPPPPPSPPAPASPPAPPSPPAPAPKTP